jgi:hypothetical protein
MQGYGLLINLRAMNNVSIDLAAGTATISAGALTGEVLEAAHAAKAHVVLGTCNTVGAIPPMLGGGIGPLISLYGLAIDNFISARVITASGSTITVSENENADLWYALRGAGHNFGIVSSLTVKAYPQVNEGMHWSSMLVFGTEKLEEISRVMNEGLIGPGMSCTFIWARIPPTNFQPVIIAFPWYGGPESEARTKFAKLIDIGAVMEQGGMVPYSGINKPGEQACIKGRRKPMYSVGLKTFDPVAMRTIMDAWIDFTTNNPDAAASVVLVECYNYEKTREVEEGETAFPHRGRVDFEVLASMNYTDAGLDEKVGKYGRVFRDVLHGGEMGAV